MIYWIDGSAVEQALGEVPDSTQALEGLRCLGFARRHGRNFLLGERATFRQINAASPFSEEINAVYRKVEERLTATHAALSHVNTLVRVVGDRYGPPEQRVQAGRSELRVPVSCLRVPERASQPILLAENLSDCFFYEQVGYAWGARQGAGTFRLELDLVQGGGSATAGQYAYFQAQCRPCLCILDSDRRAPGAAVGTTAQRALDSDSSDCPLTAVFVLTVREIENLVPSRIMWELVDSGALQRPAVTSVTSIEASTACELRLYADLKEGQALCSLMGISIDSTGEVDYWRHHSGALSQLPHCSADCSRDWRCDQERCACEVVASLGGTLLQSALAHMGRLSPHKVDEAVGPVERSEWNRVGQTVFSWGLASDRMVA